METRIGAACGALVRSWALVPLALAFLLCFAACESRASESRKDTRGREWMLDAHYTTSTRGLHIEGKILGGELAERLTVVQLDGQNNVLSTETVAGGTYQAEALANCKRVVVYMDRAGEGVRFERDLP